MAGSCDAHPKISEIRAGVLRSLDKEEALGYRSLILRNIEPSSIGGGTVEFANHLKRIKLVVSRIVRGLYFLNNPGLRIPKSYKMTVFIGHEYLAYGAKNVDKLRELFSPLESATPRGIGEPGVFEYLYSAVPGTDGFATAWYLRFFGGYEFFAHSLPDGDQRALATHFPRIHNLHLLPELETAFVPSCAEFSKWAVEAMGGSFEQPTADTGFPTGTIPILRGRLGRYKGPGQ
jgi:hypothetical protein